MLETRFVPQLGRSVTLGAGRLAHGSPAADPIREEGARFVRAAVKAAHLSRHHHPSRTYKPIARGLQDWRGPVTLATKTHAKADHALAEKHIEPP